MTITTRDLAGELAEQYGITESAARESIDTLLGQINEIDGSEFTDEMDEQAADTIRDQIRSDLRDRTMDPRLIELADMVLTEHEAAQASERDAAAHRAERDSMIRSALAAGVPYRILTDGTGISRARLDQIRRGVR